MTDLDPTPNNRLRVRGALGPGNLVAGSVAVVIGFVADISPLIYIGLFLIVSGVVLTVLTSKQRSAS